MPAMEHTNVDREVVVGRVSGLFGIKGWLKVYSFTDPRESILQFRQWRLNGAGGARTVDVIEGRQQGKSLVVRLEGIEDRDTAAELLESEISVRRQEFPVPEDDEYYWSDLEGMQVVHRDGRVLGKVAYLLATGANDVMVVQGDREVLVPFVAGTVVLGVDSAARVINVDWEWD